MSLFKDVLKNASKVATTTIGQAGGKIAEAKDAVAVKLEAQRESNEINANTTHAEDFPAPAKPETVEQKKAKEEVAEIVASLFKELIHPFKQKAIAEIKRARKAGEQPNYEAIEVIVNPLFKTTHEINRNQAIHHVLLIASFADLALKIKFGDAKLKEEVKVNIGADAVSLDPENRRATILLDNITLSVGGEVTPTLRGVWSTMADQTKINELIAEGANPFASLENQNVNILHAEVYADSWELRSSYKLPVEHEVNGFVPPSAWTVG